MKKLTTFIILLCAISITNCTNKESELPVKETNLQTSIDVHTAIKKEDLENSIKKGIDFLHKEQLPSGEFKTIASSDPTLNKNSYYDSSPFVTSLVLYSLNSIKTKKIRAMTKKGIKFLLSEQGKNGLWKYWTKKTGKKIFPDLDDTATISFILNKNNVKTIPNKKIFYKNQIKSGLFYTWIRPVKMNNDIDCVVNANVLLYLGENARTLSTCNMLNKQVINQNNCSIYYPNKLSFYYAISKAYYNGINCLNKSKKFIINDIKSLLEKNLLFKNELSTGLAVATLNNYNFKLNGIEKIILWLLKKQKINGKWKGTPFFIAPPAQYYSSDELTTAIIIEALHKYSIN